MIKIKEEQLMLINGGGKHVAFGKTDRLEKNFNHNLYDALLSKAGVYLGHTISEITSLSVTPGVALFIFYFGIPDEETRKLIAFDVYNDAKIDELYGVLKKRMRGRRR